MKYRPHMAEDRVNLSNAIESEVRDRTGMRYVNVFTSSGKIRVSGAEWKSEWIEMLDSDWTEEIAIKKILTRWVEYRVTGE